MLDHQPLNTRSFPIKTKVKSVLGIYIYISDRQPVQRLLLGSPRSHVRPTLGTELRPQLLVASSETTFCPDAAFLLMIKDSQQRWMLPPPQKREDPCTIFTREGPLLLNPSTDRPPIDRASKPPTSAATARLFRAPVELSLAASSPDTI